MAMNSSLQGKTALVTVYPGKKSFITSGVWLDYPLMASMEIVEKPGPILTAGSRWCPQSLRDTLRTNYILKSPI